jgi:hypothetical protein
LGFVDWFEGIILFICEYLVRERVRISFWAAKGCVGPGWVGLDGVRLQLRLRLWFGFGWVCTWHSPCLDKSRQEAKKR